MKTTVKIRTGACIPCITRAQAAAKNYLTRTELDTLHLVSSSFPRAFMNNEDGSVVFFFDSENLVEADPELWYAPNAKNEEMTLPSGSVIRRMSIKRASSYGYYTKERLKAMNFEPIEEPVAYTYKNDKTIVYFYDKRTANKLPLMCVKCGESIRFKRKLCEKCYEEELAVRREEGNRIRQAYYNMQREKVLFFDLELTGFYDRDEIISITIVNARGELIMDTLVKPTHTKKWKKTEKIHGITPEMVADSPTLEELIPEIKRIFSDADNIIAYGVSTDFSHIKYIYETEAERDALHEKIRCCANEFVRFAHENHPEIVHAALIDAMDCFKIDWDGVPHTSLADTYACMRVWEALFPNYYAD